MQTVKNEREKSNAQSSRFCQRIGSTVFTVNVHFKQDGRETMEDKIFRMLKFELNDGRFYGTMKVPQADALPERGSA